MFIIERIHPVTEADKTSSGSNQAHEPSRYSLDAKDYVWTLVGYVPDSALAVDPKRFALTLVQVYGLLLFVTAFGVWLLAKSRKTNRDAERSLERSAKELGRNNRELEEFAFIAMDQRRPISLTTFPCPATAG